MNIIARNFSKDLHYELVTQWWIAHKWPVLPLDSLATFGIMIDVDDAPTCVGWLYLTDSKWSLLEWVTSNPTVSMKKVSAAIDYLIGFMMEQAVLFHKPYVFTSLRSRGLIKKYEKAGFQKSDLNMTNMVAKLG